MELSEDILFMAFRYAIGRSTYVTKEVSDAIVEKWVDISNGTKELILKEIKEAIEEKRAGMWMDVVEWERILKLEPNYPT